MSTGLVTWNDVPKYFCASNIWKMLVFSEQERRSWGFFRLQWVSILCFQSAPHNNSQTSPKHVSFDVQCTTLVCWKPLATRPTSNPNVQWFSLFRLPIYFKTMFFPWVYHAGFFCRKCVTMLVCYVCFAVYTDFGLQRKQKCRVVCCAGPSSWWNSWTLTGHASCWTLAVLVNNMSPPTAVG